VTKPTPFYLSTVILALSGTAVFLLKPGYNTNGINTEIFSWLTALFLLWVILSVCGVAFLSMGWFVPVFSRGSKRSKIVALSFDDGPHPETTPRLLTILETHKVKAAFFVTGSKAEKYPEIIRAIHAKGHLIGNHSYSHSWRNNLLSPRSLHTEIASCQNILAGITGEKPAWYRPPVGLTNPRLLPVLRSLGLRVYGWSIRTGDGVSVNWQRVEKRILKKVRGGDIILFHDGRSRGRSGTIGKETHTNADFFSVIENCIIALQKRGFALEVEGKTTQDKTSVPPGL